MSNLDFSHRETAADASCRRQSLHEQSQHGQSHSVKYVFFMTGLMLPLLLTRQFPSQARCSPKSALWPFRASRPATLALTCRVSSGDKPLISVHAHHLEINASKNTHTEQTQNGGKSNFLYKGCCTEPCYCSRVSGVLQQDCSRPRLHCTVFTDSQHNSLGGLFSHCVRLQIEKRQTNRQWDERK